MSAIPRPPINPNYRYGCHPEVRKFHFPAVGGQSPDPNAQKTASKPPDRCLLNHETQQIIKRVNAQDLIGQKPLVDFLHQKRLGNCKARSLANYCSSIIPFLRLAQTLGKSLLDQLSQTDLEIFVEQQQDRGMKPATLSLRLMCIYSFLRYLSENALIPPDRFARKIRIKIPDSLPKAMPPNDVHRLLNVVDNIRNRAIILVLLRTGMRIGELLSIRVYDVHLCEQKILIWEGEKNSIGRSVCLSVDALQALRNWFEIRDPDKEYVFYSRRGHTMVYATARLMFKKYLAKAGLAAANYGLHSLRHTFATDLLNAGMRLECLQQLLGHSSLEMTLRYARLTDKTREEEFFKAMARIEGGSHHEPDPLDCQLPPPSQTPKLLQAHGQKLSQQSKAFCSMG